MVNRLSWGFNRDRSGPSGGSANEARAAKGRARPAPRGSASSKSDPALELAQELLRGLEHFVLSTPDLDVPGFMDRLRRTAASLTSAADLEELRAYRQWAGDSLSTFGQLQRRYLSEREDELWRLLQLYQENQKLEGTSNHHFNETLRGVHDRLGTLVRLDDLRQVRERMETEIERAGTLIESKSRADQDRAEALTVQVRQLETALGEARDQANRDPLTGLYHRGAFEAQLLAALEASPPCSLAMIDVDNFKHINDTYGHLIGDEILKHAVQSLGRVARPGDVVARYGGDEFCLLAVGVTPERLADRFDRPASLRIVNFQFEDRLCSARLTLSVGVAAAVENDTAEALIHRADMALYDAKRRGKGQASIAPSPTHRPE